MTFRSLALKSVKHHLRSYLAYLLSSIFAVWMFFLYASLIFHPEINDSIGSKEIYTLFFVIEIVVATFAILFIGYSQSAFLKNRSRDLGLLQILGMSVNQCTRFIFWENLWIGAIAISLGIGFGLLFSKFFYLGISWMFQFTKPIPFHFSISALFLTIGFYVALFVFLSFWSRRMIAQMSVADLFREEVRVKKNPEFRLWKVVIALISIGMSYYLAWTSELSNLMYRMLPIMVLVLIGTFLLFSQLSVASLQWLERFPSIYYRGKNMILLSQLRFRLKDHAKVLFLVSIFASVVLTSVGVCLTYYMELERAAIAQAPYHLSVDEKLAHVDQNTLKQWINKHQLVVKQNHRLQVIQAIVDKKEQTLISESQFRRILKQSNLEDTSLPKLQAQETYQVINSQLGEKGITFVTAQVNMSLGDKNIPMTQKGVYIYYALNEHDLTRNIWVISDATFAEFNQIAKHENKNGLLLYQFDDWRKTKPLFDEWKKYKQDDWLYGLNGTYLVYSMLQDIFSALLFASLFIGVLFFLAAGSVLYFRCYMELENDRKHMRVLQKLGIELREAVGILDGQLRILFFLPFLVALCHGGVALRMFSFLFNQPFWKMYWIVVIAYLIVHFLYYLWTRYNYMYSVLKRS